MSELFDDPVALGQAIRKARRAAGMSQADLGEATGTSKSTVVRWENAEEGNGRSPQARRSIAAAVAEATGRPRHELGLPANAPGGAGVTEILRRLGDLEGRLPALHQELTTALARDIDALDARLQRLERGDDVGAAEAH